MVDQLDYSSTAVPRDYKCGTCGVTGVKLWREYNSFCPELACVECACKRSQNGHCSAPVQLADVAEDGTHIWREQRCDQIGWLVPCVPATDNESYWGYTSVPIAGVQWWKRLPLRKASDS